MFKRNSFIFLIVIFYLTFAKGNEEIGYHEVKARECTVLVPKKMHLVMGAANKGEYSYVSHSSNPLGFTAKYFILNNNEKIDNALKMLSSMYQKYKSINENDFKIDIFMHYDQYEKREIKMYVIRHGIMGIVIFDGKKNEVKDLIEYCNRTLVYSSDYNSSLNKSIMSQEIDSYDI